MANDSTTELALLAVREFTLAELAQVEHPVLARALHRVLTEAEGTDSPLAAFDNYI